LQELAEEFGEYDEDYVVGLIAAGIDGEEAVARYQAAIHKQAPPPVRTPAPKVMSGSGGVPSSGSVDLAKMSPQDTKRFVMEALRATNTE
jgi:hypothetical protein